MPDRSARNLVLTFTFAAAALGAAAGQSAREARPGDDFYAFANRAWVADTKLPPGRDTIDTTAMLRETNTRRVRAIVEGAARQPDGRDPLARKVGDYYAGWMDIAGIEAKGIAPLAADLEAIEKIEDRRALSAYLGRTLRPDDGTNSATDGLFGVWIHQGFDESERYLPHLVQSGLGLDPADYPDPAPAKAERRDRYRAHVAAMLKLAGLSEPDVRAARVLALEAAIAATHGPSEDAGDPAKVNHPWRRADFDAKAAGIDWNAYFEAAGLGRQADFIVWQPSAVTGAAALVASRPVEAWRDYLAFHLIDHHAAILPKAFRDEQAAFAGAPAAEPDRAAEAVAATEAALGEAVGRLYVARYFPPAAKSEATAMANDLRTAFRARIARVSWMSPATKQKALTKLAALNVGIGYPERWIDYSSLSITRGDAYGNMRRAEDFEYRRDLAKLARPVDPGEWAMLPQRVGGILLFSPNTMQFSAGLLQPPYFTPGGDLATNYGAAGAAMAHEFSHSFDELGNLYDAQGRFGDWWTDQDRTRFRAAAAPLIAQYDAYCPAADLCMKGSQVASESIADVAGLLVAHDAYRLALHGRPDRVRDGLSGEQRFFLAFAQRWRRLQTDAALRRQIASDTHSPGRYRVATARNLDAWYQAFGVKAGDKLYLSPEARVRIW